MWRTRYTTRADVQGALVKRAQAALARDTHQAGPQSASPIDGPPSSSDIQSTPTVASCRPATAITEVVHLDNSQVQIRKDGQAYTLCVRTAKNDVQELFLAETGEGRRVAVRVLRKAPAYANESARERVRTSTWAMRRVAERRKSSHSAGFLMWLVHSWSDDFNVYWVIVSFLLHY